MIFKNLIIVKKESSVKKNFIINVNLFQEIFFSVTFSHKDVSMLSISRDIQLQSELKRHIFSKSDSKTDSKSVALVSSLLSACVRMEEEWSCVKAVVATNGTLLFEERVRTNMSNSFLSMSEKCDRLSCVVEFNTCEQRALQRYLTTLTDLTTNVESSLFDYGFLILVYEYRRENGVSSTFSHLVSCIGNELPSRESYIYGRWSSHTKEANIHTRGYYDRAHKLFKEHTSCFPFPFHQFSSLWMVLLTGSNENFVGTINFLCQWYNCSKEQLIKSLPVAPWQFQFDNSLVGDGSPNDAVPNGAIFERLLQLQVIIDPLVVNKHFFSQLMTLHSLKPDTRILLNQWHDQIFYERLLNNAKRLVQSAIHPDDIQVRELCLFCKQDLRQLFLQWNAHESWFDGLNDSQVACNNYRAYQRVWTQWLDRSKVEDWPIDEDYHVRVSQIRQDLSKTFAPQSSAFSEPVLRFVLEPLLHYRINQDSRYAYVCHWIRSACSIQRLLTERISTHSHISSFQSYISSSHLLEWCKATCFFQTQMFLSTRQWKPIFFPVTHDFALRSLLKLDLLNTTRLVAWCAAIQRWLLQMLLGEEPDDDTFTKFQNLSFDPNWIPFLSIDSFCHLDHQKTVWMDPIKKTSHFSSSSPSYTLNSIYHYVTQWINERQFKPNLYQSNDSNEEKVLSLDNVGLPKLIIGTTIPEDKILTVPEQEDVFLLPSFSTVVEQALSPASAQYKQLFDRFVNKVKRWHNIKRQGSVSKLIPAYALDPVVIQQWEQQMTKKQNLTMF